MDTAANASPIKLPLLQTIGLSYAEWVRHFPDVMRATVVPILILSLAMGAADWLHWSLAVTTVSDLKSGSPKDPDFRLIVAQALYVFSAAFFVFFIADVAVAWHRRVILNEVPKLFGHNIHRLYYWRYVMKLQIVIAVACAPFVLLLVLIADDLDGEVSNEFDVSALAAVSFVLIMMLFIFGRLSIVLPAEATMSQHRTWSVSWKLTRGNTWRVAIGLFASGIAPECLLSVLIEWVGLVRSELSPIEILITTGAPEVWLKSAIGNQISIACILITLPIGVGFLSHCYEHFARR